MTALQPEPSKHGSHRPSVARRIATRAAEAFGTTHQKVMSRRRTHDVLPARWVAMWLCRELTPWSYPSIGRALDRHHSTVHYGVQIVRQHIADDTELGRTALRLRAEMEAGR